MFFLLPKIDEIAKSFKMVDVEWFRLSLFVMEPILIGFSAFIDFLPICVL